MALVTLAQAKRHLRIFHDDEDDAIVEKAEHASAIIVDYIKRPEHGWTEASNGANPVASDAPFVVQAAILMMIDILWEHRSGGEIEFGQADGYLSKPITSILHRYSAPTYA